MKNIIDMLVFMMWVIGYGVLCKIWIEYVKIIIISDVGDSGWGLVFGLFFFFF